MKIIFIIIYYKLLSFLKINKLNINNLIKTITFPEIVIGIVTSEKDILINLTAHIIKETCYSISYKNINKINEIISFILKNINLRGKFKTKVMLIEFNIQNIELVKYINFTHLLIHKINEIKSLYTIINNTTVECNLIINRDLPLIERFNIKYNKNITYYKIDQNSYLETEKVNYLAHNINLSDKSLFINNSKLSFCFLSDYSIESILAIYALVSVIGIAYEKLENVFDNCSFLSNYNIDKRKLKILANKNENNISYINILNLINKNKEKKTIIIGFENSNRKYTENDISWIWDIDFKNLKNKSIDKILIVGKFKFDILVRLNYSGIKNEKIILIDDIYNLTEVLKTKTKGLIYSIVCDDIESKLKGIISNENQTGAFIL